MTALAEKPDEVTSVELRTPRAAPTCVCGQPKQRGQNRCDDCYGLHNLGETFLSQTASYLDDPRCRHLVRHFPDGLSLIEIGELLGVTKERIRQIEHAAMRHFIARAKLADITAEDMRAIFQRVTIGDRVMPSEDDIGDRPSQQGRVARIFTPDSLVESDYTRALNEQLDDAHVVGLLACHAANLAEFGQ